MPNLRMYDLRHHVITRLLEDESVSERTVIELAGHVSRKMLDTYSHIRMKSKLDGVLALERKAEKKPPAVVGFRPTSRAKLQ
jgi:integrase